MAKPETGFQKIVETQGEIVVVPKKQNPPSVEKMIEELRKDKNLVKGRRFWVVDTNNYMIRTRVLITGETNTDFKAEFLPPEAQNVEMTEQILNLFRGDFEDNTTGDNKP